MKRKKISVNCRDWYQILKENRRFLSYRQDVKHRCDWTGKSGKIHVSEYTSFDGKEVLPKAPTPKTATLTKMEYSDKNIIQIEYYSKEEWEVLEENACVDLEDEIYTSAREIIEMVRRNGVDPVPYLERGRTS